jgi:hypothetical protein
VPTPYIKHVIVVDVLIENVELCLIPTMVAENDRKRYADQREHDEDEELPK